MGMEIDKKIVYELENKCIYRWENWVYNLGDVR